MAENDQDLLLLPYPRQIDFSEGEDVEIPAVGLIVAPPSLLSEARVMRDSFYSAGAMYEIVAHPGGITPILTLKLDNSYPHAQGYQLTIRRLEADQPRGIIELRAKDAAGIYYGCSTLRQLLNQHWLHLPQLTVDDYPDFPVRGVMLDISRDKVPTMETLYQLVRKLAAWKVNQLQLYTEHTFAYQNHREVWVEASPMTGQEIMELDALCREHHIDLVPNQNSLGHMERWLKHDRYIHLAETPEGFTFSWGGKSEPTTLDPRDPGSIELIGDLYDELLPHFTSGLFNVGGDEPWELGKGKSKEYVEELGGRVYLEYLQKLYNLVKSHGRQMQFWGDIIMHYPELVPMLPKDIIAMEWGYEATHDFDGHCKIFADSGIPFYVCPGTSSWNTLAGRVDNMIGNLKSAAENGLKHGAIGYLNTDWGDNGHWQPLSVSYPGFALGAAYSWCYESNQDLDVAAVLSAHVFRDRAGLMGQIAIDLGNSYKHFGLDHLNGSVLAYALQNIAQLADPSFADPVLPRWGREMKPDLSPENLRNAIALIDEQLSLLRQTEMYLVDSEIVREEYEHAAMLLRLAAEWLIFRQESPDKAPLRLWMEYAALTARQRQVWMLRNRPGGLEDSLKRPLRDLTLS
jgi:hexosaminidase